MNLTGTEGELLPGTSYRLIKRLGGGGMGSVYIAEHTALGRRDAVKLLAPHIAEDPQAMRRLEREARSTAALANPHIIDIYHLGVTTDGRPYVAMRLIPGSSLKEVLAQAGHMDVERAWVLLRQVCQALRVAHDAGIVHRDLKPDNLMIEARDNGDFVTILDFGIAKVEAETESRITQEGQVVGTPGYMAPEQALGRPVDGRADQYSMSAILYELLCGLPPYDRLGPLQTITQQITRDAKPLTEQPGGAGLPPALVSAIMRGLSRDVAERFPDIDTFQRTVDEATGVVTSAPVRTRATVEVGTIAPAAPQPSTAAQGTSGGRRAPVLIGLAVAGVGAVTAFLLAGPGPTAAPVAVVALPAAAPSGTPSVAPVSSTPLVPASAVASTPPVAPSAAGSVAAAVVASVSRGAGAKGPRTAPPSAAGRATEPPAPVSAVAAPPTTAPAPVTSAPAPAAPPSVAALAPTAPPAPPAPAGPPRLVVDPLRIIGGGSGAGIRTRLAAAEGLVRACVARTSGLKPGMSASVEYVIDEDGFFGEPKASGDALLAGCVSNTMKGTRLDRRPDTGGIRVTVPLRLEAP